MGFSAKPASFESRLTVSIVFETNETRGVYLLRNGWLSVILWVSSSVLLMLEGGTRYYTMRLCQPPRPSTVGYSLYRDFLGRWPTVVVLHHHRTIPNGYSGIHVYLWKTTGKRKNGGGIAPYLSCTSMLIVNSCFRLDTDLRIITQWLDLCKMSWLDVRIFLQYSRA